MRYLAASCKGGRYGSTQSTILALRAILATVLVHGRRSQVAIPRATPVRQRHDDHVRHQIEAGEDADRLVVMREPVGAVEFVEDRVPPRNVDSVPAREPNDDPPRLSKHGRFERRR